MAQSIFVAREEKTCPGCGQPTRCWAGQRVPGINHDCVLLCPGCKRGFRASTWGKGVGVLVGAAAAGPKAGSQPRAR